MPLNRKHIPAKHIDWHHESPRIAKPGEYGRILTGAKNGQKELIGKRYHEYFFATHVFDKISGNYIQLKTPMRIRISQEMLERQPRLVKKTKILHEKEWHETHTPDKAIERVLIPFDKVKGSRIGATPGEFAKVSVGKQDLEEFKTYLGVWTENFFIATHEEQNAEEEKKGVFEIGAWKKLKKPLIVRSNAGNLGVPITTSIFHEGEWFGKMENYKDWANKIVGISSGDTIIGLPREEISELPKREELPSLARKVIEKWPNQLIPAAIPNRLVELGMKAEPGDIAFVTATGLLTRAEKLSSFIGILEAKRFIATHEIRAKDKAWVKLGKPLVIPLGKIKTRRKATILKAEPTQQKGTDRTAEIKPSKGGTTMMRRTLGRTTMTGPILGEIPGTKGNVTKTDFSQKPTMTDPNMEKSKKKENGKNKKN